MLVSIHRFILQRNSFFGYLRKEFLSYILICMHMQQNKDAFFLEIKWIFQTKLKFNYLPD